MGKVKESSSASKRKDPARVLVIFIKLSFKRDPLNRYYALHTMTFSKNILLRSIYCDEPEMGRFKLNVGLLNVSTSDELL